MKKGVELFFSYPYVSDGQNIWGGDEELKRGTMERGKEEQRRMVCSLRNIGACGTCFGVVRLLHVMVRKVI